MISDSDTKDLVITTQVVDAADGTGYLRFVPNHHVWPFFMAVFYSPHGDIHLTYTLGDQSVTGVFHVSVSMITLTFLLVILAVLLLIAYLILCWVTAIRFFPGTFFTVTFNKTYLGDLEYETCEAVPTPRWFFPILPKTKQACSYTVEEFGISDTLPLTPGIDFESLSWFFPKGDPEFPLRDRAQGLKRAGAVNRRDLYAFAELDDARLQRIQEHYSLDNTPLNPQGISSLGNTVLYWDNEEKAKILFFLRAKEIKEVREENQQ